MVTLTEKNDDLLQLHMWLLTQLVQKILNGKYMYLFQTVLALGNFMNVKSHTCTGGANQIDLCSHVVLGTPDLVFEKIRRQILSTTGIKLLILDNVDSILSNGYTDQIYDIYRYLPRSTKGV